MDNKPKKTFWEGSFWQSIKKSAPDVAGAVLSTAGNLTGLEILNKASDLIEKSDKLTEEEKVQLLELKQMELEEYRIEVQDRDSARQREAALAKAGQRDWFQYIVGTVGLAAFIFMLYVVVYEPIKDNLQKTLFIHALGIVEGAVISIFGYYFGSSKGSKDKTSLLTHKN